MAVTDRDARICGFAYLAVVVTGIASLAWIPAKLSLGHEPEHMLAVIRANQELYRVGVAALMLNQLTFAALGFCFYRALREAAPTVALALLMLVALSVPIGLIGSAHRLDALGWATGSHALNDDQLRAVLVAQGILSGRNMVLIGQVFWGLWLLPLSFLLWRTRLVPRLISVLLALGCVGYLTAAFGDVLFADFTGMGLARVVTLPASVGEVGTCLWLLLVGAREQRSRA